MLFFIMNSSNIRTIKQGIDANLGNAILSITCAMSYTIVAFVFAWKLAFVIITIVPLVSGSAALMYVMTKKYKERELKAYENASGIAQSVLSSIRAVSAFNLQKKFIDMYSANLKKVQVTTAQKGFIYGFFNGCVEALFITILAVSVLFMVYLFQNDCEANSFGNITCSLFSISQSFTFLEPALSYLSNLSQGD